MGLWAGTRASARRRPCPEGTWSRGGAAGWGMAESAETTPPLDIPEGSDCPSEGKPRCTAEREDVVPLALQERLDAAQRLAYAPSFTRVRMGVRRERAE